MKYITLILAFLFLLFCTGCPLTKPTVARDDGTTGAAGDTAAATTPSASGDIKIEDGAGALVMKLKKDGTDYTVRDARGNTLGKLKFKDGRITIDNAKGTKIGSIKKDGGDLILDDANGKKLVSMKAKDGGYRVKDAKDTTLLKIKPKDDGFKLGDDTGKELGKVKAKGSSGKLKIMDAADKTEWVIAGPVKADVAGILIVKQLTPLQQAAFLAGGGL